MDKRKVDVIVWRFTKRRGPSELAEVLRLASRIRAGQRGARRRG